MKKFIYIFTAVILALGYTSCQSKSDRIEKLKDFVEEIGEDGKEYSEEQLEEINDEFTDMLENLEKYDNLTTDEVKEIAKIKGKYAAKFLKKSGKNFMKEMDKASDAVEGFFEGIVQE